MIKYTMFCACILCVCVSSFSMQQATENQTDARSLQTIAAAAAAQTQAQPRSESPACPCCSTGTIALRYTREQLLQLKNLPPAEKEKKMAQELEKQIDDILPETPREKQ